MQNEKEKAPAARELRSADSRDTARTYLINAAELEVNAEVLLVERLHTRVDQAGQQCALDLLHDLRTGLLGIVLGDRCAQTEVVHSVLGIELVRGSLDKDELFCRNAERLQDSEDHFLVVQRALLDEIERRLQVVEECMNI